MTSVKGRPDLAAPKRIPYGLMSLAEMINFGLGSVCMLRAQLTVEVIILRSHRNEARSDDLVDDNHKRHYKNCLKAARNVSGIFEWQTVKHRIEIIEKKLDREISRRDLGYELKVLQEILDKEIEDELVYRYPRDKRSILLGWHDQWADALQSFPSARDDIFAAVDCWAMGHSTAAVFHAMRVLEHGLGALAAELGLSYGTQQWYNIINEIEAEIKKVGNTRRNPATNKRMQFMSEAAKEFMYFKDGWRNYVSHAKGAYDEHQARSILEHVKSFMNLLASELHE